MLLRARPCLEGKQATLWVDHSVAMSLIILSCVWGLGRSALIQLAADTALDGARAPKR